MSVNPTFQTFAIEQLQRLLPGVRGRKMFGGVGVYSADLFFALIANDTLYLKTDATSQGEFEREGMKPFRPYGEEGGAMHYYGIPGDLLEDAETLRPWAEAAMAAARRGKKGK